MRHLDPDHHGPARPRRPVSARWCWSAHSCAVAMVAGMMSAGSIAMVATNAEAAATKSTKTRPKIPSKLPATPNGKRAASMVKVTLVTLNNAVLTRNFSVLWSQSSYGLRRRYSAAKLRRAFAPLIRQRVDLAPALNLQPLWRRPPQVDAHGELRLLGWFHTQPRVVRFDLRYVRERGRWRLSMIEVDTTQSAKN